MMFRGQFLIQGQKMYEICGTLCMRSRVGAKPTGSTFVKDDSTENAWRMSESGIGRFCELDFGLEKALVMHTKPEKRKINPLSSEAAISRNKPLLCLQTLQRSKSIIT